MGYKGISVSVLSNWSICEVVS